MEINNYGNIIGGTGGTAISGSDITINNHGRILPGSGGNEGQGEFPGGDKWQQRARL